MSEIEAAVGFVRAAVVGRRFFFQNEIQLQDSLEKLLLVGFAAHEVVRELPLGPRNRIDFALRTSVGLVVIEVKIKGPTSDLIRQVDRYLKLPEVAAVVVVTSMIRLTAIPETMNGKPVHSMLLRTGL